MSKTKLLKTAEIKTYTQLDSLISELECGKSRVQIGDIREIRKRIMFQLIADNGSVQNFLNKYLEKKGFKIKKNK